MNDRAFWNLISCLLGMAVGTLIVLYVATSSANAAPIAGEFERVKYANALQRDLQRSGYESWTASFGPQKNSLFIKCGHFVDPEIVTNFVKDTVLEWQAFGFVEVFMTTGEVTMVVDIKKASDIKKKKEVM